VNEPLKLLGYLFFGIYAITSVWLLINGLVQLHLLWHYKNRKRKKRTKALPQSLPFVSIQVPVYNEKYVIARLLQALAQT
jgi:cellulose synthase/poly-beta-1,6-N-acetylglucosamine synthase-like glycosyltransferase